MWNELFYGVHALDLYAHTHTKKDLISHVILEHNLDKSKTLYIGDTIADSEATKANGLAFLMVMWGYDSIGFSGDNRIDEPAEMISYIDGLKLSQTQRNTEFKESI